MEFIFDCHNYYDMKKVKLFANEFTNYAIIWYDQVFLSRKIYGERPIETREEMKAITRRRFILTHYHYHYQDLFQTPKNLRVVMSTTRGWR